MSWSAAPEDIAAALVRPLRTRPPRARGPHSSHARADRGGAGGHAPASKVPTWFSINAGRRHNADPRWLLPLICRYGHVDRNDIGAIRIAANESYFEVTERATPSFIKALAERPSPPKTKA